MGADTVVVVFGTPDPMWMVVFVFLAICAITVGGVLLALHHTAE